MEFCSPTEADLLKDLKHPGIPLIYDIDEDDTTLYIVEEYIPGESLDRMMVHPENISQELILKIGFELCDILDYLHHTAPYPILYQDLKPEHIIVCGNQVKLIDFGIASFFTGSGKNFQIYGTKEYASPEALAGMPVDTSADLYSLGKVLLTLAAQCTPPCSTQLLHTLQKATAVSVPERFETVSDFKTALNAVHTNHACQKVPHLITKIAVLGSRTGAGATHFAISLVCALNKQGIPASYLAADGSGSLPAIQEISGRLVETDGIFYGYHFTGIPAYGKGLSPLLPTSGTVVRDFGVDVTAAELEERELTVVVLSGSDWDYAKDLSFAKSLLPDESIVFVCNYHNRRAAKLFAKHLGKNVYCFPLDEDPFRITSEKERLFLSILQEKGGKKHFLQHKKGSIKTSDYRNHGLRTWMRRHASFHRTG